MWGGLLLAEAVRPPWSSSLPYRSRSSSAPCSFPARELFSSGPLVLFVGWTNLVQRIGPYFAARLALRPWQRSRHRHLARLP